ncbi:importin-11-like [Lycorma delicatula]|uniref:importin-11-like n=1 Tax=Lycorma delicatula TaxID=130591 RepID=UPI003F516F90
MDASAAHRVFEALQGAVSQNPNVLKPAESKLREWETHPGFYTILMDVFSNYNVDVNIRWMAILCLKNGVDRYWRKSTINAISDAEKNSLRNSLLNSFREPVNQIATQLAVLIAKIARLDCPREWSELIPVLLNGSQNTDPLIQHRVLLILQQVIKLLSSKRLIGDRRMFQDLTASIFPFILEQWNHHICTAISQMNEQNFGEAATSSLQKSLLLLKTLHKLTVFGFKKPHESSHVCNFLTSIFEQTKTLLECRKCFLRKYCNTGNGDFSVTAMQEMLEKKIVNLTKVLLAVLEYHPFSCIDLLRPTLEFTFYYVFTDEGEQYLFEKFLILCLNRLKAVLTSAEYKPAKIIEDTKEPETLRAYEIKKQFLDVHVVTMMCRKLITHYFLLTEQDLLLWDSDPESFVTNEGGESWKYNLRPCTETLFLALFHEHRETLCPVLVDLIRHNHVPVSPDDLPGILAKDAIYNAIGLAPFELYDEINFDEWFMTVLNEELKIKSGNYRVLRRRVAWLLGQWIGVKLSCELRPTLYAAMLPLLQPGEDMAVRLTASTTIKKAVDDFEFNTDQFLAFLEPSFDLLFSLLKEAHECDSKMHVLFVLSFIIERMGSCIKPYADSLIQYLPFLWNESSEHNMLRCAIVSTLVHLVKAVGTLNDGHPLTQFLLPVIRLSTDVKQGAHVYLMEDGLELWLAVLENTSVMTPTLLQLFDNMPPLLDGSVEYLKISLYIIQAYTLLGPEEFLQVYGEVVVRICMYLLSDVRPEGIIMIMRVLELCLKVKPTQAVVLIKPALPGILQAVHRGDDLPTVLSMYLSIIARVLLISQGMFIQVAEEVAQSMGEAVEVVVSKIFDVWLGKLHFVTQHDRRKLLGLALASLLTSQSRVVFDRFCGFLLAIAEILNDITRTDETGVYIDSLMYNEDDDYSDDGNMSELTEHYVRRRQLASIDPVHRHNLLLYFQQQMCELMSQVGSVQFNELIQTVDVETLDNVKEYVHHLQL